MKIRLGFACLLMVVVLHARGTTEAVVTFPNSGAAPAQAAFITGVIALHNFDFERAAEAFRAAQRADAGFALAYWGEAMSHNHPLWNEQDVAAGREALLRLGPTRDVRLSKAPTAREKGFVGALDNLYFADGDKATRDRRYADEMAAMYASYPDDDEVAAFYSLALLGSIQRGERGFRRQALAAAVAQRVFRRNPQHPGAAHYIIHAFDDPEHAPLGLDAARAYAPLAPDAPHPIHMPSHIFVQMGLWPEVAASNQRGYAVATDLVGKGQSVAGRDDFHALSWLAYAQQMLGQYAAADASLLRARRTAEADPGNARVLAGYRSMWARHVIETERWDTPLWGNAGSGASGAEGHQHAPGAAEPVPQLDVVFAQGVADARRGRVEAAERRLAQLEAMKAAMPAAGANATRQQLLDATAAELRAIIALERGNVDQALEFAKAAAEAEGALRAPSGPPDPVKPAHELYGEMLLAQERWRDAADQFSRSLLRTPGRTSSLWGLARAAAGGGDTEAARRAFEELKRMLEGRADANFPPLRDANQFLATRR